MAGNGTALRTAERVVSVRGGLLGFLGRRSAIELVVFDVLVASAAAIAALPSSVQIEPGNVVALLALLPGISALARAAASAASVPGGLTLDQLDPRVDPRGDAMLDPARHVTAAGLGLLTVGGVAAGAALLLL